MSSLIDYLNSWWYDSTPTENHENSADDIVPPAPPVTPVTPVGQFSSKGLPCLPIKFSDELLKIKLRSINIPGPARNMPPTMPLSRFQLNMLTKGHLDAILNVKLKKVNVPPRPSYFETRHPVLKELQQKIRKT